METGSMISIYITGVLEIPIFQNISGQFDAAMQDPGVSGIRFIIDSPGGAYCADGIELAEKIFQSRPKKVLFSWVKECYSAAYWLASATSEIYAVSKESQIGAIGVLRQPDFSDIPPSTRTYLYTPDEQCRLDEFKTIIRKTVIEATAPDENEVFLDAVSRYRNIPLDRVREIANWKKIYTAVEAREHNLIDGII